MSYCLNPTCPRPENPIQSKVCQACGFQLLLRDRYRVLRALAKGGFGATFLAQDQGLPGEPSCVIKQLRPSASEPDILQMARELFAREAKTMGKVGSHPQVPRLLDYFEVNQQFYLVQEYINGWTLQEEVKRSGPFSEAGVKQFLSEILPILQYIHDRQVIHRDIKPANLICRSEDRKLVLIDFGAVKDQVNHTLTNVSGQTALTAFAVGTPGFAPPEQLAMRPVYASDIYAVGVTCIYLLTGKTPKDLDYNHSTGEMIWQNKVQLSNHFGKVLKKMLEGSVRHRYQSANELLRALDLEPYMDSLAKGMTAQPCGGKKRSPNQAQPGSGGFPSSPPSGSSRSSATELAAAIRARRAKLTEANTSVQPGIQRHGVLTTTPTAAMKPITPISTDEKPKLLRKLDTNSLLTAYNKGRRDFAQHDLSLLDLQRADLSETNFRCSKLDKTNFHKAHLIKSDFSRASLKQVNLREASLSKAYLNQADLEGADLRGADLSYAYLNNANLRGANLCGANLTGAKFSEAQIAQAHTNLMTVWPNGKRGLMMNSYSSMGVEPAS